MMTTSGASFVESGFRRGDYIAFSGMSAGAVTTSGVAKGRDVSGTRRITSVSAAVLDFREVHPFRAIEWLHARAEDRFLWPLADLKAKLRVRA